jgi:L-2-hydroxyglutarate oxidase
MDAPARDVAVIGGGIVGMATAAKILEGYRATVVVLEAEDRLAAQQTGRNSGVIHSGIYYRPGSRKAKLCVEGRLELERFCEAGGIPFERCGKIIVAATPREEERLKELQVHAKRNGLAGVTKLGPLGIREIEPHANGLSALHVPETGIVDFGRVTEALADAVRERGGAVETGAGVTAVRRDGSTLVLETSRGAFPAGHLVNCAGLQSDRMASLCGVEAGVRIVPFRGMYWKLRPERAGLVSNLIYPVPDPDFPFLGVHFTRRLDGTVEAGPNAVLALMRGGDSPWSFSREDLFETLRFSGFRTLASRHWKMGAGEVFRAMWKPGLASALRKLVPEVRASDLLPGGSGVRAQAVDTFGNLLDDFQIAEADRMLHVLNAPSPAATASLAIGRYLAERAAERFSLEPVS